MDKALFLALSQDRDSDSWGLVLVHLKGVLSGLDAANHQLLGRGDRPLYCPPPDAVFDPDWAATELNAYLARYPKIPDNMSIAIVLGFAMTALYPCAADTGADAPQSNGVRKNS